MKKPLLVLASLLMLIPPAMSAKPVIGELQWDLDDAGCSFYSRHLPADSKPVFISSFQEAWMVVNGQEIVLKEKARKNNNRTTVYEADRTQVIFKLGKKLRPDSEDHKASLTIIHQGKKASLPLKGWCGC